MSDKKKTVALLVLICLLPVISAENYVIKNVNIIPMTEETVIENASVFVADGIIEATGDFDELIYPGDTELIVLENF